MMHTIRYLVSLVLATVWYGPRIIVASWRGVKWEPGGFYDRESQGWGASLIKMNRIPLVPSGLDRFDHREPYVFASNHSSMVDIWALLSIIPNSLRFVAKEELFKVPIFGPAMTSSGHISIQRGKLKSAFGSYDKASAKIRSGISAAVFPEGTRSDEGKLLPFKRGPFVMAIQAGVPVVPVYIVDAWRVLQPGSIRIKPAPVEIRFGTPIPTKGLSPADRDALAQRTHDAVERLRDGVDDPPGD
jgi:1-acyl-sn-glycerol-3-phosphate acyltransferase